MGKLIKSTKLEYVFNNTALKVAFYENLYLAFKIYKWMSKGQVALMWKNVATDMGIICYSRRGLCLDNIYKIVAVRML